MQQTRFQIKEAAKLVEVESHVLRYWEEELELTIRRNEQGHRYYTKEDISTFQFVKDMKKQGYQLRAIKKIIAEKISAGDEDLTEPSNEKEISEKQEINIIDNEIDENGHAHFSVIARSGKEDKAMKLQRLLQQIISDAVKEHDEKLCEGIKESVVKELDYQFRIQEEEHFKRLDELLRDKQKKKKRCFK